MEHGAYRKIFRRLWRNPDFLSLHDGARNFTFYLLTGPQTNRIGLFRLSLATAADDLHRTPKDMAANMRAVTAAFGWEYDESSKVCWIPSWWKWNPPGDNVKAFKGAMADLVDVPRCPLVTKFCQHLLYVPEEMQQYVPKWSKEQVEARYASDRRSIGDDIPVRSQETETQQETQQETETQTPPAVMDATTLAFEQFRQAYPVARRVGGKEGRRAFLSALKGRDVSTHLPVLLAALEQHKRSEQWQTPKYIPLMTTWLNQERWETHLPEPRVMGQSPKTAGNQAALERFVARKQGMGS